MPGDDADKQCKHCPLVVPVHPGVYRRGIKGDLEEFDFKRKGKKKVEGLRSMMLLEILQMVELFSRKAAQHSLHQHFQT